MNNDFFDFDMIRSKKLVTKNNENRYHLINEIGKSLWEDNGKGYMTRKAAYKTYINEKKPELYEAYDIQELDDILDELCDRDEKEEAKEDNISNPKHYKLDGLDIESIDVVKAVLGEEGFINFCLGNILKYAIRAKKKGQFDSDIGKIKTYCEFIAETKTQKSVSVTIFDGLRNMVKAVRKYVGIE